MILFLFTNTFLVKINFFRDIKEEKLKLLHIFLLALISYRW